MLKVPSRHSVTFNYNCLNFIVTTKLLKHLVERNRPLFQSSQHWILNIICGFPPHIYSADFLPLNFMEKCANHTRIYYELPLFTRCFCKGSFCLYPLISRLPMHRDVWQENNLEQGKKSREPKSQNS